MAKLRVWITNDRSDWCGWCKKPPTPEAPCIALFERGGKGQDNSLTYVHESCLAKAIRKAKAEALLTAVQS